MLLVPVLVLEYHRVRLLGSLPQYLSQAAVAAAAAAVQTPAVDTADMALEPANLCPRSHQQMLAADTVDMALELANRLRRSNQQMPAADIADMASRPLNQQTPVSCTAHTTSH